MSELMRDWLGSVWECLSGMLSEPWSMLAMDALVAISPVELEIG
jgi:hypothetical protein